MVPHFDFDFPQLAFSLIVLYDVCYFRIFLKYRSFGSVRKNDKSSKIRHFQF